MRPSKMKKSLPLKIYEAICPDDVIRDEDPRRDAIIAEMEAVLSETDINKAADIIEWWGFSNYESSRRGAKVFVRRAWRLAKAKKVGGR